MTGPSDGIVDAYTDGACSGNPGPGGWGALLVWGDRERTLKGGEAETTNNRMELTAAIEALGALTRATAVRVHTDSTYLKDGVTKWLVRWKANGWRTADRKPVKNQDLWLKLDAALARHRVTWRWVRGHAGHRGNERADALARAGMDGFLTKRPGRMAASARPDHSGPS